MSKEPKKQESQDEAPEPSVSLGVEETSLIIDGLNSLPQDRTKTVVFDRLMMKLGKVQNYWVKVEKARQIRRDQVTSQLLDPKK